MNVFNILNGMKSFIKKQEELEAKRQLDMMPIRQKYEKEMEEFNKLNDDEKFKREYPPRLPIELGTMNRDYWFAMSLKLLLQEILLDDKDAQGDEMSKDEIN